MSVFLKLFGLLILSVNVWFCFGELFEECNDIKLTDPWNVRFDLSRYMLKNDSNEKDYYCVKDIDANSNNGRKYNYCFNICDNVLSYPYSDEWTNSTTYCQDLNTTYCESTENVNETIQCLSSKLIEGTGISLHVFEEHIIYYNIIYIIYNIYM